MLKNRKLLGILLSIFMVLALTVSGFTYYKYTQESGANFYVGTGDKADAQEDTNEMRQILDDLGDLLGHSKRDDLYPKDGTTGGTLSVFTNIVYCNDYDHPDDAITAIDTANKTLLVTEAETCDTNFTVPANVTVKFERGGKWTINGEYFGDTTFTGTGLNDATIGGTYTGTADLNYKIEIDGTGTPDTFKWSDDGGSTWDATLVAIDGTAQALNNGVTVTFGATTGHTLADYWTVTAYHAITVTFNGQIDAGLWQIFAYVGTGVVTSLTQEVFTAWWGGDVGVQINAAVAALSNNRGTITIPPGDYSFNTEIVLDDEINLRGLGQAVTKLNWTGTINTEDIITTNGNRLTLRDFAVYVETGKAARSIIYIQNTRSSHFINLYLSGDSGNNTTTLNGIYAEGNTDNNVYYNLFENVGVFYCNETWHLAGTSITQNTFTNCRGSNSGIYGFYGTGHKFIFVGCCFENNDSVGLKIFYGAAVVTGCYFESNISTDIYIDHPDGMVVQGCRFKTSDTKDYIIYCTGISGEYDGIQIRDNIFKNTVGTVTTAIYLCNGAEASGNVFVVVSGAITNEYYTPTGSRVNECPLVFPSTQISSTNANTLDDYKEGNWTPDLQFGGAKVGITYTLQGGLYTKIGRMMTATGIIVLSSKGTSTGTALIEGLPSTSKNDNGAYSAVSLKLTNVTFANAFQGTVNKNTAHITLQEITEAGVQTTLTNADFANDSTVVFSATYFTD